MWGLSFTTLFTKLISIATSTDVLSELPLENVLDIVNEMDDIHWIILCS